MSNNTESTTKFSYIRELVVILDEQLNMNLQTKSNIIFVDSHCRKGESSLSYICQGEYLTHSLAMAGATLEITNG